MYARWFVLVMACLGFGAFGCATGATYRVQVNGYAAASQPAALAPGTSFFVFTNKDAKNPLLEEEIKAKINKLLQNQGFSLAPQDKAEYFIFFTYGMGAPQAVTVTTPEWGWGVGFGWGRPSYYGFFWPGWYTYPQQTVALYDRWLLLNVVEAKHYRATGKSQPVWVGEARSTGESQDLREVMNPLLLAVFAQFGKNTGKAVKVEINQQEPRFRDLEQVR